ncbi:MAG: hypothetical protein LAN71_17795 [Acidobacteriia bacterium]|nr:hypothetical protein [Terriglobia bacterium]
MTNAANDIPTLRFGNKIYPQNLIEFGTPLSTGRVWFVDGDKSTGQAGATWEDAFSTIQAAINAASSGDVIYIAERTIPVVNGSLGSVGTDPISYDEHLTIPNSKSSLSLIGVSRGLTQGGLPQIKPTTTVTGDILQIKAAGCLIANLGFNGAGLTADTGANGIELYDDGGLTASTFGTTIMGCHFKSLGRGHAGAAAAIDAPLGASWQLRIQDNRFHNCLVGIGFDTTSTDRGQDIVITGNSFSSTVNTNVDCDIFLKGLAGGCEGIVIDNNMFATVDVPTHSGGASQRYLDLTGCEGILSNNFFACKTGTEDTPVTFGATTHTAGIVPATVRMAGNYGEAAVGSKANGFGDIYRQD